MYVYEPRPLLSRHEISVVKLIKCLQNCWMDGTGSCAKSLDPRLFSKPVSARKSQYKFAWRHFQYLGDFQAGPFLGKVTAKHAGYVKQRVAAADQAGIVRAVAHNIAFSAQNRILQRDRIETPAPLRGSFETQILHHRTSPKSWFNCTDLVTDGYRLS